MIYFEMPISNKINVKNVFIFNIEYEPTFPNRLSNNYQVLHMNLCYNLYEKMMI